MNKFICTALLLTFALPVAAIAQQSSSNQFGPASGDREFSISGTGSGDKNFNNGSFGVTGDMGWYQRDHLVLGLRQSVNYASIKGENITNDFWNGSTRGYVNYQFDMTQARPFVGGSLGLIYGDGVKDSGFAGLETGVKYYVIPKTYLLARVEYQFFFNSNRSEFDEGFKDGAWAYTIGLGYNF